MNLTSKLEYNVVTKARDRELKLLIRLKAPAIAARKRKPLNLGVVIDRSGSMAGEKIENTKHAIKTLITHLGPEDYLCLVQFDDAVQTLLEPSKVTDKDALKQLVDKIDTGGSTNLSAGWLQGVNLIARNANAERVNRCLLLTDGQANVGIQEPSQLIHMGKSARQQRNIVTTTLGFGEGFNEDLLTGISREAGGAFYYVDKAEQAPAIFSEELQGLLKLAAQNIQIEVLPASPVELMTQWTDYPAVVHAKGMRFSMGDAYADEEKNLLVSMWIPGMADTGSATIARIEASFAQIGEAEVVMKQIISEVRLHVADDVEAQDAQPDVEVLQQFGLQLAAHARKDAIEKADSGDYQGAKFSLMDVAAKLEHLPDPGDLLAEEARELRQQAETLNETNYSHDRKVMREVAFSASTGRYDLVTKSRARIAKRIHLLGKSPKASSTRC